MTAPTADARGELAPTRAYTRRGYQVLPADGREDRDFTLVVTITHGRRVLRTEFFWYAVQVEWEAALDFGLASFLLENERDKDIDGPFRCVVGGMINTCGCEAGKIAAARGESATCKHADSLRAIVEQGAV